GFHASGKERSLRSTSRQAVRLVRMKKTSGFSRRGPDIVTEELASVLSRKTSFEFKPLFDVVHANLRARNAASGGEEMLRLRTYEKLQSLVQQGMVTKVMTNGIKKYKGIASALLAVTNPPPVVPVVPVAPPVAR